MAASSHDAPEAIASASSPSPPLSSTSSPLRPFVPPRSPHLSPASPRGCSNISSLAASLELERPLAVMSLQAAAAEMDDQPVASTSSLPPLPPSPPSDPDAADAAGSAVEAQTLMQMLTLVGSRLIEADQIGLSDAAQQDEDDEIHSRSTSGDDSMSSSRELDPAMSTAKDAPAIAGRDAFAARSGSKRLAGIRSELFHDDSCEHRSKGVSDDKQAADPGVASRRPPLATPRGGQTPLGASMSSTRPLSRLQTPLSPGAEPQAGSSSSSSSSGESSDEEPEAVPASIPSRLDELSTKLQSIFSLPAEERVRFFASCWLFRSVLLQGHVYLTDGHLLFYAYLPTRADKVIKAGHLRKRTRKTLRFSHHWAVLRGRALSWYDSQHDPYFPRGHIDLRDVSEIRPSATNPRHLRVVTPRRTFVFGVDSQSSRDDWVETLKKTAFRAQNQGESVRISIPIEAIVDVDSTSTSSGAQMAADLVSVQVIEWQSNEFALDEYHFLHFAGDQKQALVEQLRQKLQEASASASGSTSSSHRPMSSLKARDSTGSLRPEAAPTSLDDVPRLESVDPNRGPRQESRASPVPTSTATPAIAIPARAGAKSSEADEGVSPTAEEGGLSSTLRANQMYGTGEAWGYPPRLVDGAPPSTSQRRSWNVMPDWAKTVPSRLLSVGGAAARGSLSSIAANRHGILRPITEVWSSPPPRLEAEAGAGPPQDLSDSVYSNFSVLDSLTSDDEEDRQRLAEEHSVAWFRDTFALPPDEELHRQIDAYLYRVLPLAGSLFISDRHLCFLSEASQIANKAMGQTKMVLPLREIISCAKHRAFRFGQHGLVLTIRGHEELFLEFASIQRRDECLGFIEAHIEQGGQADATRLSELERERSDAIILTDLVAQQQQSATMSDSISSLTSSPAASESDSNVSLLSFKPKESLNFTLLTIGSRGDVQPYLALAKGLAADGHKVRIATHAEFGPWIQQHGIDFREIGGDPAELMRICVENGTFTVSFLREGVTKFRGWLDDLLVSCWQACQGSDVIIESPNAIAGIHVAEALRVPYLRAFTMPWSRTRAYPQAFAVPSKRAGGSYNYLSYVIFDQVLWRASSGQINRWRKSCLNLAPTTYDDLEQHKIPFLYSFSPSLVPKPLDWYDWIHVTGFWYLDNPETANWTPPRDLVDFIESARARGKKIVYIGWGSITVPDAAATTRCVLEAVRRSNVCAILSKGWSERLSKGGVTRRHEDEDPLSAASSPDVFHVESVPHDWLFPLMDAACHHGGAGTIGASLRAGLPTIVKPWFGDQFFWGQQVESLGVGSCVKELNVASLSAALVEATQNQRQIERAKVLGEKIRRENGVAEAIRAIYADLDYATTLIQRRSAREQSRRGGAASLAPGRRAAAREGSGGGDGGGGSEGRSRSTSISVAGSEDWSVVSEGEEARSTDCS